MSRTIKVGSTNQSIDVFVADSSSTTGAGLTGLVYNTASLVAYYKLPNAAPVSITLVNLAADTTAHADGGFRASTNMPGVYRLDLPDAAVASGDRVLVMLYGAANMAPVVKEIFLTAVDMQDATDLGLTNLDAAITSRMATYVQPTGFLAATFPGTVASTTNITAGTITTVTNLTNLPSIPNNWITAAGIASDAITAAKVAADVGTEIAAATWSSGTRTLTAGTNIVLAKGTGVTGFNDLSAAQVNAECATALSDVGLTTTVTGRIDAAISTRLAGASYTAPDNASITAIKGTTDKIDTTLVLDGPVYQFTANALELAPTGGGGGLTAEDVWTYGTRNLTSGANIVLAKGTGITGLNDISTAQVKTQADAALSDVGLTPTITGRIDAAISTRMATFSYTAPDNDGIGTLLSGVAAIYGDTHTALPAQIGALSIPTAAEVADAVHDEAIDGAYTFRQSMRLINSAIWGIVSGAATNEVVFRDVSDTKNRIVADVDENGNRTDVEVDPS